MNNPSNTDTSNLEADYIRMKVLLYKNLFRYCTVIILIILIKEACRAIFYSKFGSLVMLSVVFSFGGLSIYFIGRQKENQEFSITICLLLLFLSGLMTQFYSNSGYFDVPLETFNVAYAYAAFERIVWMRIAKFSHRTGFLVCTTTLRALIIRAPSPALVIMQFVYMSFTIYLDLDRERYDKKFFAKYFKNKEQLLKFKNLVVQDIPESIIIITQDLMKPLFVNDSFDQLFEGTIKKDIRTQLQQFILQDNLDVSQESSQDSVASIHQKKEETLLMFLESTVHKVRRNSQNQKFSCNLSYTKTGSQKGQNQEFIFEAKTIHLLWDDEPAIAVTLHDITQQHTILSLKIADAHKDTILATVSHELRTPLNGILGMIQIMEKRIKDNEISRYLSICKNSGLLLLSLVNSILDLNQIRAKKLKLCIEKVNINELLENIVRLFEFQCQLKGLDLKLKIAPNCSKYVKTDKNRLSQIFINLVGNALKFTQKGAITISAYETSTLKDIIFDVEDTGSGIKDEDQRKLFKMFGKLEQSNRDVNPHGVGLGLTISDKLARLLGDERIQLKSQYGKGSKFTFSIKKLLIEPEEPGNLILDEKIDVRAKMLNYSTNFVKGSYQLSSTVCSTKGNISLDWPHNSLPTQINRNSISFTSGTHPSRFSFLKTSSYNNTTLSNIIPYVLIVDDNPLNTMIVESLISAHGYKARTAFHGQTAIDIVLNCDYSSEPIKLILMDCQMPGMDGFMATRILKKMMLEKRVPEIPILALTANDSEADREESKRAGMCAHMTKPLKEGELVNMLNKYMSQ